VRPDGRNRQTTPELASTRESNDPSLATSGSCRDRKN